MGLLDGLLENVLGIGAQQGHGSMSQVADAEWPGVQ
jgi:hypothetical protein